MIWQLYRWISIYTDRSFIYEDLNDMPLWTHKRVVFFLDPENVISRMSEIDEMAWHMRWHTDFIWIVCNRFNSHNNEKCYYFHLKNYEYSDAYRKWILSLIWIQALNFKAVSADLKIQLPIYIRIITGKCRKWTSLITKRFPKFIQTACTKATVNLKENRFLVQVKFIRSVKLFIYIYCMYIQTIRDFRFTFLNSLASLK